MVVAILSTFGRETPWTSGEWKPASHHGCCAGRESLTRDPKSDTPVIISDWLPSLLDAAGVELPFEIDGRNLRTVLEGKSDPAFNCSLVWHFPNFWGPLSNAGPVEGLGMGPSSTIRRGDWKLIYYHADQRFDLFNLAEDLSEDFNLANREPQRVRELARDLSDILRVHRAPMPVVAKTGQPVPLRVEVLSR